MLEYSAHVSIHNIRRALSFTTFSVPDDSIRVLKLADLPGNWKAFPHPQETRDLGSRLLSENLSLVIKIPSVIIEYICLINPNNPRASEAKLIAVTDYPCDLRIKSWDFLL